MAVYQEKDKSKWTKDGRSWYFRCYYSDMYGNLKQKQSKFYKTKAEAKADESVFLVKVATNDETDLNILFESVCREWLQYKKQLVKYSTYYKIEKMVEKHILPTFNKFKLHFIKTNNLMLWKEYLDKNTKLSPESQNKVIGYFQEILEYARINYDFNIKVSSKLQKNKVPKRIDRINDSEWNFWTFEEFSKFIEIVDNFYDKTMYMFLYYTGLRLGEMIALNWNDIDFERKELKINKTFTYKSENQKYDITDPKTNNSIRMIDLDDELINLLKQLYEQEQRLYGFNKKMFMFGNIKHTAPTTFTNHLNKYIEKANVKRISAHGFRHSHVSLLIHLGCDSREVAKRVGDTVDMIERTYYHMFPEKKSNPVNVLNNFKKIENKR